MRVVSLLPAATEIVHALGAGDRLVGRSHECDHPPEVAELPAVTESKLDPSKTSLAIEGQVADLLREGLSIYRVDPQALDALSPDLIITQDQCEVCAVSLAEVEAAACELVGSRPGILSLHPRTLDDVLGDIERVGAAIGEGGRGRALAASLRGRMEELAAMASERDPSPRVAVLEWIDPPMAGGNWMPTLLDMAGARSLFAEAGAHSPWLDWQALLDADPDVVLVVPCGFDLARTRGEFEALPRREGWRDLSAVRQGRVFLADGHAYFNRPGPRIVDSLEILLEMLHPGVFDFGHHGSGWIRAGDLSD